MSEKVFTESQLHAIEARDGTVLVSAAAGSGKTSVLVERIMRIVCDESLDVDADRFLAVTFTNAAADNIAALLRSHLQARISEDPDNRRLKRQNLLLKRASISTVHSFCIALLREYFSLLDIPFDFTVCDALTASSLSDGAMEAALLELYGDDSSGIKELSELFGKARSDNATAELILKLDRFESNLAFPSNWESECISELSSELPIQKTRAGMMLLTYTKEALDSAKSYILEALSLCADDPCFSSTQDTLNADLDCVNRLSAFADKGDWDGCFLVVNSLNFKRFCSGKQADEDVKERVKTLRDKAKDIVTKLAETVFVSNGADYFSDRSAALSAVKTLFFAAKRYRELLFEEKLSRRTFDFSDIERLTLKLLCGEDGTRTKVCDEISTRFDFILVDEYQDTNEIQDLIFKLVSRDEKNLFFVGDVKQSIYSFRRADPTIFVSRRNACYPDEAGLYPKRIDLTNNFRSSLSVIDAVNTVFSKIMSDKAGGTDYDGEALMPFDASPNDDEHGLELHLLDKLCVSEPVQLARRIKELIDGGYKVRDKEGLRPCRAGDFCILLRSVKDKAAAYKQALDESGVRAWTDSNDNFFSSSEVAVAMALLRIIDNPRRSLELCSVMLSPLFGFTEDELLKLRCGDKTAPFYTLVLRNRDPHCVDFVRTLTELRSFARSSLLAETVRFALDKTSSEVLLCAGADFNARRNNLRRLVEYASAFDRGDNSSLSHFLAVCERAARADKSPDTGGFSPPSDAVCVISVHKSKGLEWPVVILADANKNFNLQDSTDSPLLFSAALGAGLKRKQPMPDKVSFIAKKSVGFAALSLESRLNTKNEEMRVLYVALTRAKQKLIVCGTVNDVSKTLDALSLTAALGKPLPFAVNSYNSFLDWILLGLLCDPRNCLVKALNASDHVCGFLEVRLGALPTESQVETKETAEPDADPKTVTEIDRKLSFRYKNEALFGIPTKLSVSELSHKSGASLYKPTFARAALSGAEKGTAIHLFMQLADYRAAAVSAKAELERLVKGEYIDPVSAESVSIEKLERLFAGELGRRIVAAPRCLREFAFIDAVFASSIFPLSGDTDGTVLIQGIADCVLLEEDGAVLIDYKSDRVKTADELVDRYSAQLSLYERALNKRLEKPVKEIIIYSFELNSLVRLK